MFDEDGRGVSRTAVATGVAILAIVAIVVAAALGSAPSFAPGTEEPQDGPDVNFEFVHSEGSVTIEHAGGADIDTGELYVDVEGGANETWWALDPDLRRGDPIRAGELVTVTDVSPGATIRLVWISPTGERAVLETYTV